MNRLHLQKKLPAAPDAPGLTEFHDSSKGQSAIFQAEVEDLERELRAVGKKQRRHFVWAVTGVSPAAFIFATGLVLHGNLGLIIPLFLLVTIFQFYLGGKAATRAHRLKQAINRLREEESSDRL